uniref:Uncharacterized protein n=1 Tax=Lactuca sativa TaxID=4236 RepID=A0A9R1X1F6_LACSA|nr:hypothetical protein LSAT_V11C700354420 [Lactuca sativa]
MYIRFGEKIVYLWSVEGINIVAALQKVYGISELKAGGKAKTRLLINQTKLNFLDRDTYVKSSYFIVEMAATSTSEVSSTMKESPNWLEMHDEPMENIL